MKTDGLDLNTVQKDNPEGCILGDGLEYQKNLNNFHNDYLHTSEKIKKKESMLSNQCEEIAGKYNISLVEVKKLVPS